MWAPVLLYCSRNPNTGSLILSETGSLDRMMKSALDRKKKALGSEDTCKPSVSGRVEGTRVDAESLIEEILRDTKLDQVDETAESE